MHWPVPKTLLVTLLATVGSGSTSARSTKPESVEIRREGERTVPDAGWIFDSAPGSGVPADVFARAMTSLASHYRDDFEALNAHLEEEHAVFLEQSPEATRAYLCCTEYSKGLAVKSALESACGSKASVRTALNNRAFDAYCAIARLSPAEAAKAHTVVHEDARCSPLTHATKEPVSLLELAATVSGDGTEGREGGGSGEAFGLRIAPSLKDGLGRGLVVSLCPGSLPVENVAHSDRVKEGTRGGAAANRQLIEADVRKTPSSALGELEEKWRTFWRNTRRVGDRGGLADMIPWTSSSRLVRGQGGDGERRLVVSEDEGVLGRITSRAQEFHSGKVQGYKAALKHLDEKMVAEGTVLSEACGWDSNLSLVHRRNDVIFVRGIHRDDHDEATAAACFVGLVGFLSAQPDVVHIHPEARAEASNKVLTAYMEGGDTTETPMRDSGLDGTGQVIGLTDTGLDESSCFFRDDDYGSVPRTTAEDAEFYPDRRKVIQYVDHADGWDANGHGTHVAGIAAGQITSDWETKWTEDVSPDVCEEKNMTLSCFGVCVDEMVSDSCHWNPELACPISDCDDDISCDDYTGYIFPCFGDPDEEIPAASGMAPGAKLAFFDIGASDGSLDIPDDLAGMWGAQYAAGARILSNSWSLITMTEPTSRDVELDEWIHDNPDAFVVFGAGNNGFEDGSFNPSSVQSPATAKTAMTVGVSNSGPERAYAYYTTASSNYDGVLWPYEDVTFEVSPFSARGPVGAFTTKPDVVAPGLMVHSARASLSEEEQETCALASLGGTSMSAPAVAGTAALVRQYFSDGFLAAYLDEEGLCEEGGAYERAGLCESFEPSGYLVKAVLVNSAAWLGHMQTVSYNDTTQWMEVVDFAQGFGAVQLSSALPTESYPGEAFFHDNSLSSDDIYYYLIYVNDPSEELSMTTAWYDPPSTVSSYNLLHDLDTYIMSVDTGIYFRSNSYSTIKAMCGKDEDCAQKYDFTFSNKLADYMNPVERVVVSADELDTGYYVLSVRARTLTESDTQAYGLAVCGGGLELSDLADSWSNLGLETLSTEPNPDEEEFAPTAYPTELGDVTASPTQSPSVSRTAAPTAVDPFDNAEPATSGTDESEDDYWYEKSDDDSGDAIFSSSGTNESSGSSSTSSSSSSSSSSTSSSTSSEVVTTSSARIGDADTGVPGNGTETRLGGDSGGNGGGGQTGAIVAIAVSAAVVVAVGLGFVCWRRRVLRNSGRGNGLGKEINGVSLVTRSASPAKISQAPEDGGDEGEDQMLRTEEFEGVENDDVGEGGGLQGAGVGSRMPVIQAYLPSYAAAVASASEERDEVEEVSAVGDSEESAFYMAVDPNAVSKLVGWGISRDFARVALRRKDNDVTEALKLIAEGNMDKLLAEDQEDMAYMDTAASSAETVVAGAVTEGDSDEPGLTTPLESSF